MRVVLYLHTLGGVRKVVSCAEGQRSLDAASFVTLVKQQWVVLGPYLCMYQRTITRTIVVRDLCSLE